MIAAVRPPLQAQERRQLHKTYFPVLQLSQRLHQAMVIPITCAHRQQPTEVDQGYHDLMRSTNTDRRCSQRRSRRGKRHPHGRLSRKVSRTGDHSSLRSHRGNSHRCRRNRSLIGTSQARRRRNSSSADQMNLRPKCRLVLK